MFSLDSLVKYSLFFKRKWFVIWQMGPSWKKKKILKIEFYLENVFFWKIIINLKTQSKLERNEGKELNISLIEWKAKNNLKN